MKNAVALVTLASFLVPAARAEDSPRVPDAFLACAKIQDAAARVRCYDAQVAAMKQGAGGAAPAAGSASSRASTAAPKSSVPPPAESASRTAPSVAKTTPAPAPARQSSGAAHFGEEELPLSQRPKASRKPHETLSSNITAVSKGPQGIYYFSLANGQVWRADSSSTSQGFQLALLFRVGDSIRIQRGALGSYHMWTPKVGAKNWMYVNRIR